MGSSEHCGCMCRCGCRCECACGWSERKRKEKRKMLRTKGGKEREEFGRECTFIIIFAVVCIVWMLDVCLSCIEAQKAIRVNWIE